MVANLLLAAATRPNSLDREVSAIPAHDLLFKNPYQLIDPARATAALHYQQSTIPLWLAAIAVQIVILAWFWQSGLAARLRDHLRRRLPSEFAVRFFFGALTALIAQLAAFIPQLIQYRLMRIMDLTSIQTRFWIGGWIEVTIFAMIIAGLLAAVILWLADATHQWYLYVIGAIMGGTLLMAYVNPYVFAPLFTKYAPFPASTAQTIGLDDLRRKAQNVQAPVVQALVAKSTSTSNVYVMGWGNSQRIVVSDTYIAGATIPEIRFSVARQLGWVLRNDTLQIALIEGGFFVLGAALAVFAADRIGFRRDDDPVSRLALVGALLGIIFLIAVPFFNSYLRHLDIASDDYAIALTSDRVSGIRSAVRGADQSLLPICPSRWAYWYLTIHPPPGERIPELQNRPAVCR